MDLTCIKCDRRGSVTEHLHNLSPYSLHSMIEGSTKAWHAILYGTPEFIVFHEIMPGMMKFGLFMGKIILEIVSEKYREEYREKYSELIEDLYEFFNEFFGAVSQHSISDRARSFCSCCSRAICLTVAVCANTSHFQVGPITHSVCVFRASSISQT